MGQRGIRFAWQAGYAAFSVSASEYEAVKRYIANQAEHHRKQTFEEELVAMLKRAGIAYDPEKILGLACRPCGARIEALTAEDAEDAESTFR